MRIASFELILSDLHAVICKDALIHATILFPAKTFRYALTFDVLFGRTELST